MKTVGSKQKVRKRITSDKSLFAIRLNEELIRMINEIVDNDKYKVDLRYTWGKNKPTRTQVIRQALYGGLKNLLSELK